MRIDVSEVRMYRNLEKIKSQRLSRMSELGALSCLEGWRWVRAEADGAAGGKSGLQITAEVIFGSILQGSC